MKIRIGGVPYGVGAPLLAGLDSDPTATLTQAPPTQLIARLRAGELDAALVSSIEAMRESKVSGMVRVLIGISTCRGAAVWRCAAAALSTAPRF